MDYFRGGNPRHARQFRNEALRGFKAVIIAPPLAHGLTHATYSFWRNVSALGLSSAVISPSPSARAPALWASTGRLGGLPLCKWQRAICALDVRPLQPTSKP